MTSRKLYSEQGYICSIFKSKQSLSETFLLTSWSLRRSVMLFKMRHSIHNDDAENHIVVIRPIIDLCFINKFQNSAMMQLYE